MNRAYSLLTIKSVDDDARVIEGVATTPSTDRQGDIVEPLGAEFSLPLPALLFHDSENPVASVEWAKPDKTGIPYRMRFPAAGVLQSVDKAWTLVKEKLVRGVSIGFRALETEPIKNSKVGGIRFIRWEWLELSLVAIPANAEATISTIKSLDQSQLRAASGAEQSRVVRLSLPGASGQTAVSPKGNQMNTTTRQHIAGLEAKRAANVARQAEVSQPSIDEGRSMNETEGTEHEGLTTEIKAIDVDLQRFRDQEALSIDKAVAVPASAGTDPAQATAARQGVIYMGGNNLPKGTAFARYAIALTKSNGNLMQAAEIAKHWKDSTPEVELTLKAAVAVGTTTDAAWAAPLVVYQNMASEFIELLRPSTIIGKIQGLRRVPFNVSMARTTAGSTSAWVGEDNPKPVSRMSFETITLGHTKIATIVVLTEELVRFSNPSAEAIVSADMREAIATYSDAQFIDPTVTASAGIRPASITNGATSHAMTAATIAGITTDVSTMFADFSTANFEASPVWIMHPRTARFLSMLRTTQDVFAFPGVSQMGGTFFGYPVITSNSVPIDTGADTYIVLLNPSDILLADDGGITLDVSREASLQIDGAPSDSAASQISLWQKNLVGLRAERFINYRRRRDAAVSVLTGVSY